MTSTRGSIDWTSLGRHTLIVAISTFATMMLTFRFVPLSYGAGELPVYPLWPAAGVNMALLYLLGIGCWPGVLVGSALANVAWFWGEPYVASYALLSPWGNGAEALLGVWLLRRTSKGLHPLRTLPGAARLIFLTGLVASAVGGLLSVTLIHLVESRHWGSFAASLLEWNLSSFIAVLVLFPIITVWVGRRPIRWTRTRLGQAMILALLLGAAQGWLFLQRNPGAWIPPEPMVLIALPFVFWAGSQFGALGAAQAVVFTAVTAVLGTMMGQGPFDGYNGERQLIILQLYLVIIAVVGILIGAVSEERQAAHAALERRAAFDRLLFDELNHRVRNTLASLLSVIEIGKRESRSVEEYSSLVSGRVHALARVHDLLTDRRWKPISLRAIIRGVSGGEQHPRLSVSGDSVEIQPSQAAAVGMIIHELIVNAHRHGALGKPQGLAEVRWTVEPDSPGSMRLRLEWIESGAPVTHCDWRPGDGMRLMEGLIRADLRGRAEFEITLAGAHHRFEFVLDAASVHGAALAC